MILTGVLIFGGACGQDAAAPGLDATPLSQDVPPAPQGIAALREAVPQESMAMEAAVPAQDQERYGLIAGSITDQGFNQLAWLGLQRAANELGVEVKYLETQPAEAEENIRQLVHEGYHGIVSVGFLFAEATRLASQAQPTVPFVGVDFPSQTAGDMGLLFATDEPAFMAGYLAAGMSQTGTVCTYGGLPVPPVLIFMVGFEQGVKHYNQQHGTEVQVLGWNTDPAVAIGGEGTFAGTFDQREEGSRLAEMFFNQGCDVIFPVAGAVGLGSAAVAQERGLMMIGVDADLAQTAPEFREVYLTSVLKKVDVAVFEAVKQIHEGSFEGGTNYIGTLANDGVGLAPFHSYEDEVPEQLRIKLEQLKQGLVNETIATGWPIRLSEVMPSEQ